MILIISEKLQQKLATGTYILSYSLLAFWKMKKDVESNNSNKNTIMKKIMEKYPQKLVSLSSTSIPIKKKKLHLPRFCSCHSEEKEQIKLNIQKTLK